MENEAETAGDIVPVEAGGQIPDLSGTPAYTLTRYAGRAVPLLLAVPHDGRSYSDQLLSNMRDPTSVCQRLEDRHVSQIAREVARQVGIDILEAHAPRAAIDLNRSADDIDWEWVGRRKGDPVRHSTNNRRARSGLGLVPRRMSGAGEIWKKRPTIAEIDDRIAAIHEPYHQALTNELEALRDKFGIALLLDIHSMPPLKASDPEDAPAEFIIGDRFGAASDGGLSELALNYLTARGRRVAHNRPYAGGYILDRYGQPVRGIHAIQLEICRSLYLDVQLAEPSARLPAVARTVAGLAEALVYELQGSRGGLRWAAE